MSLALVALKQVASGIKALQSFDKHSSAAQRAAAGKNPYPQSKSVDAEMSKLRSGSKELGRIAGQGIGKPAEELDWSTLGKLIEQLEGSEEQRDQAGRTFYAVLMPRLNFVQQWQEFGSKADLLGREASKRCDAAVRVRDRFADLVDKFPDPTGSSIKVALLASYEAFEAASGALASLASSAQESSARVEKDLKPVIQKNEELKQAFAAAYNATSKQAR